MDKASLRATILCFSHDQSLLKTRQWMLEQASYVVLGVMTQPEFRTQICSTEIHLILLCQTLSEDECTDAASFVGQYAPTARCVLLRTGRARALPAGDLVVVDLSKGPANFLDTIARMLPAAPIQRPSS
jgi:hypothetical protein